ncbi:coiled-coil domain-containing protein 22 homolog [Saccostrea cucullata]|uniref:coiled-coil domain-containing protein 22 homolog n=1 Tax=Saccostrea cuccullata TaxID=36930 RepID=UPI002ED577E0
MEEVDRIIIFSIRAIGCDIDEEIVSLKEFSTELIVSSAVQCIKTILKQDVDLPNTLPGGMSARFRMGTGLANYIQELGYKGEIGYQTFLYSNESEIRKVFMFLVDKLPKDTAETAEEPMGSSALLQRAIASTVLRQINSPWISPNLKQDSITWRGRPPTWQREGSCAMCSYHACKLKYPSGTGDLTKKVPKELKSYYCECLPYLTNQTINHKDTGPSILEEMASEISEQMEWETEWNTQGLASRLSVQDYRARKRQRIQKRLAETLRQDFKRSQEASASRTAQDLQQILDKMGSRASTAKTKGSRFTHTEQLVFAKDEALSQIGTEAEKPHTEEELQKQREEELLGLKQDLESVNSRFDQLDLEVKKYNAGVKQMEEEITTQTRQNAEKEESYKVKKRTLDLLPEAETNIAKLQAIIDSSAQKLVTLANQWEKHRVPLIEQFRELKQLNSLKESEAEKKLEEIKAFRQKMKEVADDARNKEEMLKHLHAEYSSMTKDEKRSGYTKRMMEIMSSIKKQRDEIDKVLIDTRSIQKEINNLEGKLGRTFTVTDELIFKDAKRDESVKKAYRHLAALHENCEQLVKTVTDTGVIMREIRELEDQIMYESKNKVLSNLEKITKDYQQMKKENQSMIEKIKHKS